MTKNDSLIVCGFKSFCAAIGVFALMATMLYVLECFDAKTFPFVPTAYDLDEYAPLAAWALGICALIWIFLMVKEILKRRNFDLETLNDDRSTEPLSQRVLKQATTKIAGLAILLGSTLILIPTGFISLENYVTGFQSTWFFAVGAFAVGWIIEILSEVIKRQWRKFRAR